jgi:hypothetical protein
MIFEPLQVKEVVYPGIQRRVVHLLMIEQQAELELSFLLVSQPPFIKDGGLVATGRYNDVT